MSEWNYTDFPKNHPIDVVHIDGDRMTIVFCTKSNIVNFTWRQVGTDKYFLRKSFRNRWKRSVQEKS